MHRKVAVALVALLALGLASCGGRKTLSAKDFKTQVSNVCQRVAAQVGALESAATASNKVASLHRAAADMTAGLKQMEAIKAPAAMEVSYARLKAGWTARRDAALELAKPHPHLSAASASAVSAHDNSVNAAAQSLGLRSCY